MWKAITDFFNRPNNNLGLSSEQYLLFCQLMQRGEKEAANRLLEEAKRKAERKKQ
jgi:hypothetical protein